MNWMQFSIIINNILTFLGCVMLFVAMIIVVRNRKKDFSEIRWKLWVLYGSFIFLFGLNNFVDFLGYFIFKSIKVQAIFYNFTTVALWLVVYYVYKNIKHFSQPFTDTQTIRITDPKTEKSRDIEITVIHDKITDISKLMEEIQSITKS